MLLLVRLLAEETNFPDKALGEDIVGLPLLAIYRPSSIPVKIGWKPRVDALQVLNFDGIVPLLLSWCWRVCGFLPSRTREVRLTRRDQKMDARTFLCGCDNGNGKFGEQRNEYQYIRGIWTVYTVYTTCCPFVQSFFVVIHYNQSLLTD